MTTMATITRNRSPRPITTNSRREGERPRGRGGRSPRSGAGSAAPPGARRRRRAGHARVARRCRRRRSATHPGRAVGVEHGLERVDRRVVEGLEGLGDHLGDGEPADPAGQERRHRDLVRRVEPRRRAAARPPRLIGEVQAREQALVRRLEGELDRRGPVDRAEGDPEALGEPERVADGESHVWAPTAARASRRRPARPSSGRSTGDARRRRCGRSRSPKSSWASITSRPLFMSVDESIVILGPIFQVGCASASSRLTSASWSRVLPRNGPPDAVMSRRGRRPRSAPPSARHWWRAQCSESTGHDLGPRGRPGPLDDRGAGDERLLVGEREPPPGLERGQRDRQPGEADHPVHHDVGRGRRGQQDPRVRRRPRCRPGRARTSFCASSASPIATSRGRRTPAPARPRGRRSSGRPARRPRSGRRWPRRRRSPGYRSTRSSRPG